MADRINFDKNINESVQVGDELYYLIPPSTIPIKAGPSAATCVITSVEEKHIIVDNLLSGLTAESTFFMFLKPEHNGYTNVSGLKGYYAEVIMSSVPGFVTVSGVTVPAGKKELFAVGSEVTVSSK